MSIEEDVKAAHAAIADCGDYMFASINKHVLGRLLAELEARGKDAERLNALRDNSWDLRCISVPTGAGDADIDWVFIEHHMAKPHEREIAQAFTDDPRAAIDTALSKGAQEGVSRG